MNRAYLSLASREVSQRTGSDLLGSLSASLPFAVEPAQTAAWQYQIRHLSELADGLPDAHFLMEFLIPRMGRRADLIVLSQGIVFVVEYKVGAKTFDRHGLDQVFGYALDLKQFHETSHPLPIVPILVATEAAAGESQPLSWDSERIAVPLCVCPGSLVEAICRIGSASTFPQLILFIGLQAVTDPRQQSLKLLRRFTVAIALKRSLVQRRARKISPARLNTCLEQLNVQSQSGKRSFALLPAFRVLGNLSLD